MPSTPGTQLATPGTGIARAGTPGLPKCGTPGALSPSKNANVSTISFFGGDELLSPIRRSKKKAKKTFSKETTDALVKCIMEKTNDTIPNVRAKALTSVGITVLSNEAKLLEPVLCDVSKKGTEHRLANTSGTQFGKTQVGEKGPENLQSTAEDFVVLEIVSSLFQRGIEDPKPMVRRAALALLDIDAPSALGHFGPRGPKPKVRR